MNEFVFKRNELLAKYKYIYVDECQDVSGIQDAIIKSLTGPGHQFFMCSTLHDQSFLQYDDLIAISDC